jgi:hypothetical protein
MQEERRVCAGVRRIVNYFADDTFLEEFWQLTSHSPIPEMTVPQSGQAPLLSLSVSIT